MKVLFAVNSENISDAIIQKYQRDYREILSYKNVYYFNAIQKEIQKDKSYDRIVISADLEPFSNNNYESIDKFIFEKLDGISDEANDNHGNEISIILICSDRHTKGSSFLVKLFGLGIYNALLGNDRSMEEVCRLINKPRTKKEAKIYYKIDTDDVNYKTESDDEVDEMQIQNILFHFRKLGKNTEKYASSFENIAAQYTDEQLKIIINCLPMNVKRVLAETSTKFQEVMAANGMMVQGIKNNNMENQEDQKRTGLKIDIIENKLNQTKMNGPIVIPNSVKSAGTQNVKKVVTVPQKSQEPEKTTTQLEKKTETVTPVQQVPKVAPQLKNTTTKTEANAVEEKLVRLPNGKIVRKKVVKPERKIADIPENNHPNPVVTPPASPKVRKVEEVEDEFSDLDDFTNPTPMKTTPVNQPVQLEDLENSEAPKKGRGRPRKNPIQEAKPKGKRGRPRKVALEELEEEPKLELEPQNDLEELPDLETITEEQVGLNSFEEDDFNTNLKEEPENNDFADFLTDDEDFSQEELVQEEPENEELAEIEIPELDELDDIDDFDENEKDEFGNLTEESFDEFEDYDEYGQYETKTQLNSEPEDVDTLYQEDILSAKNENTDEIMEEDEMSDFDMTSIDELEESTDDAFEMDLGQSEEDNMLLSDFEPQDDLLSEEDYNTEEDDTLLGLEEDTPIMDEASLENDFEENSNSYETMDSQEDVNYETEAIQSVESPIDYSMSNLNSLMTKDKKIVTFLGSPKNGVSFLVNNLAELFASIGINTAILDMTQNRNSYYIYTQNEEALRKIAYASFEKLQNGLAEGIAVKQNLTVYTGLPNDGKEYNNVEGILSTLVQNHSLILIDCDFETNPAYFASAQEIYLVQSMDILTIQPLTAFLRDLKAQGVFEPEKVRVVINKELKVRGLTTKVIIDGMSSYNDPAMSFMTELFDKEIVKNCTIPFEEMAYSKYLEGMLNCKVSISGYSKNFMSKLQSLGAMVYPLTSRKTYSAGEKQSFSKNHFSSSMNDTLNKMKKKY